MPTVSAWLCHDSCQCGRWPPCGPLWLFPMSWKEYSTTRRDKLRTNAVSIWSDVWRTRHDLNWNLNWRLTAIPNFQRHFDKTEKCTLSKKYGLESRGGCDRVRKGAGWRLGTFIQEPHTSSYSSFLQPTPYTCATIRGSNAQHGRTCCGIQGEAVTFACPSPLLSRSGLAEGGGETHQHSTW